MDPNELRELVARLRTSASALAVVTLALDAATTGQPLDPALAERVDDVLRVLGAADAIRAAGPAERMLLGEIRHAWHLDHKLATGAQRRPGWTHGEPELLQTTGTVTTPFAHALKNVLAPRLAGLVERLETPAAAFLDVGCGVGMLSIELARLWPQVHAVAIDVWGPALGLARENVARSDVADRVELREQAGEDLTEVDRYDLAWIPAPFIPGDGPLRIARRAFDALRPGGWLLYAIIRPAADPLVNALARLRATTFGGEWTTEPEVEAALIGMGFTEAQTLPAPPNSPVAVIAARRPLR